MIHFLFPLKSFLTGEFYQAHDSTAEFTRPDVISILTNGGDSGASRAFHRCMHDPSFPFPAGIPPEKRSCLQLTFSAG